MRATGNFRPGANLGGLENAPHPLTVASADEAVRRIEKRLLKQAP